MTGGALAVGGGFWHVRAVRAVWLTLGFLVGCGASTPSSNPPEASSSAPVPSASAAPAASAKAPEAPPEQTAGATAPAASAKKTDVLLETVLPPKTTAAGGSYSMAINDPQGLAKTELLAAVEKSSKQVDGCYAPVFKASGKKGKTSFAIALDAKAKPRTIKLQGDELNDKTLVKCLEGALKKVEWPRPGDKAGASFVVEWLAQGN